MIQNELRILRQYVDGNIETVKIGDAIIICDNEGRIRGNQMNCIFADRPEISFCGTIIIAGVDGEDLCGFPMIFRALTSAFVCDAATAGTTMSRRSPALQIRTDNGYPIKKSYYVCENSAYMLNPNY